MRRRGQGRAHSCVGCDQRERPGAYQPDFFYLLRTAWFCGSLVLDPCYCFDPGTPRVCVLVVVQDVLRRLTTLMQNETANLISGTSFVARMWDVEGSDPVGGAPARWCGCHAAV